MSGRKEFPAKVRVQAFERAGGKCEQCTATIRPGNGPEYDHIVADAIGGLPTLSNCQVLCRNCHGRKTSEKDVPAIAKTKRVRGKHINASGKSRGFRGWRRFDGSVVYRGQQ